MKKMLVSLLVGCSLMMGCSNVNAEMVGEGNTSVKREVAKVEKVEEVEEEYCNLNKSSLLRDETRGHKSLKENQVSEFLANEKVSGYVSNYWIDKGKLCTKDSEWGYQNTIFYSEFDGNNWDNCIYVIFDGMNEDELEEKFNMSEMGRDGVFYFEGTCTYEVKSPNPNKPKTKHLYIYVTTDKLELVEVK